MSAPGFLSHPAYGEISYSNNVLQNCSVQSMYLSEYLDPVSSDLKIPVLLFLYHISNEKATVSCNTSAADFYVLDMYQSIWDDVPLLPIIQNTGIVWDAQNVSSLWAAASRQVYLNIFAPNNRLGNDILRPSLLAMNLEMLQVQYVGIISDRSWLISKILTHPTPRILLQRTRGLWR